MRAIVLAAGRGKRLRPWTDSRPKCLINFKDRTLLEHNISILGKYGVKHIVLVIGYLKDMIIEKIGSEFANTKIEYITNSVYEEGGSGHSLWLARGKIENENIIMDSDILFDERILENLLNSGYKDCMVVDRELVDTGEEVKVTAEYGIIKDLGKKIGNYSSCVGEMIGITRLSKEGCELLVKELGRFSHKGVVMAEYEDAIGNMVKRYKVHCIFIYGLPWVEIDFPQDLEKARNEVYPVISRGGTA